MELTQEYVKALFDYKDGALYWKVNRGPNKLIGKRAGYLRVDKTRPNYKRWYTNINTKPFAYARLIFLMFKGWLPEIVDHEDRNPENDRIENLRAADFSGNSKNRTSAKGSSSKYLGVCLCKGKNKWEASLNFRRPGIKRKQISGGAFFKESDAALAYNKLAVKYHGEFASLNIIKP